MLIEADRVELLAGVPQPVDVPRDDGSTQRIFRCPTCQVSVYSDYGRPEVLFVRGGTLDQPSGVTPDVHIFTKSKLSWVTLPDSVPAFEVFYDRKALWPTASLERLGAIAAVGSICSRVSCRTTMSKSVGRGAASSCARTAIRRACALVSQCTDGRLRQGVGIGTSQASELAGAMIASNRSILAAGHRAFMS